MSERVFVGDSQAEVISQIKREFGSDAMIISTQKLQGGRGYAVTAKPRKKRLGPPARPGKSRDRNVLAVQQRLAEEMARRRSAQKMSEKLQTNIDFTADDEIYMNFSTDPYEQPLAGQPAGTYQMPRIVRLGKEPAEEKLETPTPAREPVVEEQNSSVVTKHTSNISERASELDKEIVKQVQGFKRETARRLEHLEQFIGEINRKLSEISEKVSLVDASQEKKRHPVIERLVLHLRGRDVDEEVVQDIAMRTQKMIASSPNPLTDQEVASLFRREMSAGIPEPAPTPFMEPGEEGWKVVTLGPAGCGKTTSLIKLVRELGGRKKKRVGVAMLKLIQHHVGAEQQMVRFSQTLGFQTFSIMKPVEMKNNLEIFSRDKDIVFLDTPGMIAPGTREDITELKKYLDMLDRKNSLLYAVLPATWKTSDLKRFTHNIQVLDIDGYIFTAIGETKNWGNIFSLLYHSPISAVLWTSGSSPAGRVLPASRKAIIDRLFTKA